MTRRRRRRGLLLALLAMVNLAVGWRLYLLWTNYSPWKHPPLIDIGPGFQVSLFAAEPDVILPVAISHAPDGRLFIAEHRRFKHGVESNQDAPGLLIEDLRLTTVEERGELLREWAGHFDGGWKRFSEKSDRVRVMWDKNGDGRADEIKTFAEDFDLPIQGIGAGIMAWDDRIYYACVPDLWSLTDADGDFQAETRKSLITGFGVNLAFPGHDLHGLAMGHDGRIYFSVGDRGFHVTDERGESHSGPGTGAIFRCEPDGSGFEVIATGFRNPQDLAFDDHGNLFTADNNADFGDRSRLIHVAYGGDYGWHMSFQTYSWAWMNEGRWDKFNPERPMWVLPAAGYIASAPAGLAFYPGSGLPSSYQGRFFLCDYGLSIDMFSVRSQGAGFVLDDYHLFAEVTDAVDFEFGWNGRIYIATHPIWTAWTTERGKGRVYEAFHQKAVQSPAVRQLGEIAREGFDARSGEELCALLAHPDRRIRLGAQFELAGRGTSSCVDFLKTLDASSGERARLHALWGLGMLARSRPELAGRIIPFLDDSHSEIRAQSARMLGDLARSGADQSLRGALSESLHGALTDPKPRVRYFAAIALGRLGGGEAIGKVVRMLKENRSEDSLLEHAGAFALAGPADETLLETLIVDESLSVRRAALLALRRLRSPFIARFLDDSSPAIVAEAARAIYDLPIESALPVLAESIENSNILAINKKALHLRILNANYRLGGLRPYRNLLAYASNAALAEEMRLEALRILHEWNRPARRDRLLGFYRPVNHPSDPAIKQTLRAALPSLAPALTDRMKPFALKLAAMLGGSEASLSGLPVKAWVDSLLQSDDVKIREDAIQFIYRFDPIKSMRLVRKALEGESLKGKQMAYRLLGKWDSPEADEQIFNAMRQVVEGLVPLNLHGDILAASRKKPARRVQELVLKHEGRLAGLYKPMQFPFLLHGGDAEQGKWIFERHPKAQCVRCHSINGVGGRAGPSLTRVGSRLSPPEILESLIDPNAMKAEGYQSVIIKLKNGRYVHGKLDKEADRSVYIVQSDDNRPVQIRKEEVEEFELGDSPMPSMASILTQLELRDLTAYLTALK